jgi:WS/DGAT/MGAT family acyltransferase
MSQLSGMDDLFLHFERSGIPMHVGSLALYQPPANGKVAPGFEQIRESVLRGVERAPLLRRRLVATPLHLDRPWWAEAGQRELDQHVKRIPLASPGGWEELRRVATRFFEAPLDLARPLFEVAVIEHLHDVPGVAPGGFALATKVHHALLDGVSGVEVMRAFSDADADAEEGAVHLEPPGPEPSIALRLARAGSNRLDRGVVAARLAARSLRTLTTPASRAPEPKSAEGAAPAVPRTSFNGRPGRARSVGGCRFPLSEVRAIREAVPGATVNDVVLTVVGGALRRSLEESGELPDSPVVAMAPISIRESRNDAGSQDVGGNRISMMAVGLGTDVADPLERLGRIHERASVSKRTSSAAGSSTMVDLAELIPSALGELAARGFRGLGLSSLLPPFFNCVVTNVPGPQEPLYLAGSRMVGCYGFGPIFDGVGLIHPVLSYDGGITISFTSCPEMLPDAARYEQLLVQSFEELVAVTGSGNAPDVAVGGGGSR